MKTAPYFILSSLLILSLAGCKNKPAQEAQETETQNKTFTVIESPYGMVEGKDIILYTLMAPNGFTVSITNYGGTVVSILAPDKSGDLGNVALGFDNLEGYLQPKNPYFGCTVGRYANRIANAQFQLGGKTYTLSPNDNGNMLHGGKKGFDKVVWRGNYGQSDTSAYLTLGYISQDGEEGFPGLMPVTVTFTIDGNYGLQIDYMAKTDKPTPVNLTNHTYFNLGAGKAPDILGHELMLRASRYTPVNDQLIPTGKIEPVSGGPMDFTVPKAIGEDLAQVKGGYDHNFILNKNNKSLDLAATLYHKATGRYMEMWTTEPAVQFYSGNFLDGSLKGREGKSMVKHYGLCLEAQHYPDSPNQPDFPGTILNPGELYLQKTIYRFSTK
ncbi:MAG: Aldose 1-epimerase [Haliscomenobacter sp.]|jgi:aldose 1-epimerase|nr:Aldose 1-epimerase [Haliscomenobacter sp.]